ncbi:tetraspanin-33-like [Mytilus edulis]|uniref:tetraspanin-33-like n=1 Tax=Mytilus edulis TaxID=6550 RepID=UPI0039F12592
MARRREKSEINPIVKYLLFSLNFVFWILGLAFAILGTYILILKHKVVKDAFDFFLDPSTIMCTAGAVIVFVAFFGCMGALRENTCFLQFFNYLVTFMFVGEIVFVIFVFVFYFVPDAREQLGLFPEKSMHEAIIKYGVVDDDDMVNFIDNIQQTLKCCGLGDKEDGFLDWNDNMYYNCTTTSKSPEKCSVPASCCKIKEGDIRNILCGKNVMDPKPDGSVAPGANVDKIYTVGCLKSLGNWINSNALVAGGVLLGVLIPQMFIMCVSRTLRYQIKAQKAKWDRPENRPNKFQGDGPYYINVPKDRNQRAGRYHGVNNPAFDHHS